MSTVHDGAGEGRPSYPPNWDDLRRLVLERAEYRCEGSLRYPECRAENGRPHPVTGAMVVLAAAHLYDDDEETTDIARLRCLCQRCHTAYDADLHMRRAAENRAAKRENGAGGGRRISVYEASVRAATVEVKALVISGKQITLSVFRQLEEEDLIRWEDATLRGTPWGRVNYFWGSCKPDHVHVVWQKDDELRRACVFPPAANVADPGEDYWRADSPPWAMSREAERLLTGWVVWCIAEQAKLPGIWSQFKAQTLEIRLNGERLSVGVADDPFALFEERYQGKTPRPLNWFAYGRARGMDATASVQEVELAYRADLLERERATVDRLRAEHGTRDALRAAINETTGAMATHRARYKEAYTTLCAVDQLFIAV